MMSAAEEDVDKCFCFCSVGAGASIEGCCGDDDEDGFATTATE